MKAEVFNYNGSPVTFQLGEVTMVNATEMAKPFGKRPTDWLKYQQSQDFIDALSKVRNITLADLVIVTKGGNSAGTWMHEDVALEFARWLSPQFAIWCNDRIKELMRHGVTGTPEGIVSILSNPENAILLLKEIQRGREALAAANSRITSLEAANHGCRAENRRLQQEIEYDEEVIMRQGPYVAYAEQAMRCPQTFTSTQLAKEHGMSARAFHQLLKEERVMYRQGGRWYLYARYQGKGYVRTREKIVRTRDGDDMLVLKTVWTTKGRIFIHELMAAIEKERAQGEG